MKSASKIGSSASFTADCTTWSRCSGSPAARSSHRPGYRLLPRRLRTNSRSSDPAEDRRAGPPAPAPTARGATPSIPVVRPLRPVTGLSASDETGPSVPPRPRQPTTSLPPARWQRTGPGRPGWFPTFTLEPIDGTGAQVCPCSIAAATPHTFTAASRTGDMNQPRNSQPARRLPDQAAPGRCDDPAAKVSHLHLAHERLVALQVTGPQLVRPIRSELTVDQVLGGLGPPYFGSTFVMVGQAEPRRRVAHGHP